MYNNYNEGFIKNFKSVSKQKDKSFGIRMDHAIVFVVIALFASKVLILYGLYGIFMKMTLILTMFTFAVLYFSSNTYRFMKSIYFCQQDKLIFAINSDFMFFLCANSMCDSTFISRTIQKIKAISIKGLMIILLFHMLFCMFVLYLIIAIVFFIENLINLLVTSLFWGKI